ncbi:MAG: hypothetical protein QOK10_3439 [Pseudonocardiales bacterium]|jgi:hypothetical protein|nr:hypothetical protein [Pseudonocardiales bacterium]
MAGAVIVPLLALHDVTVCNLEQPRCHQSVIIAYRPILNREPHRQADPDDSTIGHQHRFGQGSMNPFHEALCLGIRLQTERQNKEFIAAESCDGVPASHGRAKAVRNLGQHLVAGQR